MVFNKKYICFFTGLYLLLITFNGYALAIDFDSRDSRIDLPVLSTPNNATSPSMAADNDGHVYVTWSDNRGGSYGIYTNTYFPNTGWNFRAIPITAGFPRPRDAQEGDATTPQICADNSGHVYVSWVDDRAVKAGTGKLDIYFRYSKDYGTTWYPEFTDKRIDTDNPAIGKSENLRMSCDDKGNVYFVWEDDRTKAGRPEVFFRSLIVKFNKPSDFIEYYQTPDVRINTGIDAGLFSATSPAISSDNNNNVYISWNDSRNKPEDKIYKGIYFNVSHNNGNSWKPSATRIDTAGVAGFLTYSAPVMSSDSYGDVYIAWTDNAGRPLLGELYSPDGTPDVYFNYSNNFGETWGKEDQRIEMPNYGDHQSVPFDVAIGSNDEGVVLIAWADDRFGDKSYNIFTNHSESFGHKFLDNDSNIRIDTGITEAGLAKAGSPMVKVDAHGTVFISWIDNRSGTSDLFFNFSAEKGKQYSWQESDYWIDYPIPPGESVQPKMSIDNAGHFYIVWMDTRSALAKDNYNIYFLGGFFDIQTLQIEGQRLGKACFIATAAYGSPFESHVALLRSFRDRYLITNNTGKAFVELYYHFSPAAADYILKHVYLKPVVRLALLPAVGLAAFFVYTSLVQKVLVLMVFLHIAGFIIRNKKQEVRSKKLEVRSKK
ncbi:MAG: hypothetical protein HZA08_13955 [Nitrospirae bacterium]|nr:hypothetical protein [Nitrospirota bacterium]